MALQNKLKAFVRFDGSGRVIPSSLILQKSKPKVGNWKEINATECCNGTPTTTTTSSSSTSTSTSTTTTTTQVQSYSWQAFYGESSKSEACSGTPLTIYTSTPYLSDNVNVYLNPSLTQPVLHNYISSGGRVWQCMSGFMYGEQNCASLTTTTTTTNGTGLYAISNAASAGADYQFCAFPISQLNQQPNLHCSTPTLQVGSTLYASNNINDPVTFSYVGNVDFAGAYAVSNGVITSFIPC